MSEDSLKFPAVVVLKSALGVAEGTILKFDWASGKYVSIVEEEDIADDYYYSGYAVAIDPYLVKGNIGTYFAYSGTEPPVVAAEPAVEPAAVSEPGEGPVEPKQNKLIVSCKCGHEKVLDVVDSDGLTAVIMANDPTSYIELHCEACDSRMRLFFAGGENEYSTEEDTEE